MTSASHRLDRKWRIRKLPIKYTNYKVRRSRRWKSIETSSVISRSCIWNLCSTALINFWLRPSLLTPLWMRDLQSGPVNSLWLYDNTTRTIAYRITGSFSAKLNHVYWASSVPNAPSLHSKTIMTFSNFKSKSWNKYKLTATKTSSNGLITWIRSLKFGRT